MGEYTALRVVTMSEFSLLYRYRSSSRAQSGPRQCTGDPVENVVLRTQKLSHVEAAHHRVEDVEPRGEDVFASQDHPGVPQSFVGRLVREQVSPVLHARTREDPVVHHVAVVVRDTGVEL